MFLSSKKNPDSISFKIDWIEHISFAGSLETCMYSGGLKREDGSITGWRETEAMSEDEKARLRQELLTYCGQDTLAMAKIRDELLSRA